MRVFLGLNDKLVEARRSGKQQFCLLPELGSSISSLGQILLRQLFQAFAAINGHINCRHGGDERLVGADVGGGFLAADVLLAGGESEDKATFAVRSLVSPASRPGIWRTNFSLVASTPA